MTNKIGFMPDALYRNSKIVLNKYKKKFYGSERTEFISRVLLGRCKIVRNLFSAKRVL